MSIRSFLKLVEIQTKVASMIPFLIGTLFSIFYFDKFIYQNFIYMFISLLFIDMCTTAINNYIDYKTANKKEGYGYESHNAIVRDNLKESTVLLTIFILLTIAIVFGILLYLNTNVVVLIIGIISFMIGILYTFGPVPISRTPFGEIFSGGFMGLIIPFLSVYIHNFDQNIITINLDSGLLSLSFDYIKILSVILISIPSAVGIANIMLANNICDIEDDIENRRYTLPIYIGKKNSLVIFKVLYYIGYIAIIFAIIFELLHLISVLVLLTLIIVQKNIMTFDKMQSKKDTFVLSVKNFVIINFSMVLTLGIALIINMLR